MSAVVEVNPTVSRYYVPPPPRSNFVALFWYWRGYEKEYSRERIMPMGTCELVIRLGDSRTGGVVVGPHAESSIIERRMQDALLGIHFQSGGVFPFLNVPVSELQALHLDLPDVWGPSKTSELLCRLHEAGTIDGMFRVLEHWLMRMAARPLQHHPAVTFALNAFQRDPTVVSSASIADRIGLSQRRFIELFHQQVGLTPKLFCRVERFQRVIGSVGNSKTVDWADLAVSCGYFDQPHLNHDFRRLSSLTPMEYLQLRTPHVNHVKVRD